VSIFRLRDPTVELIRTRVTIGWHMRVPYRPLLSPSGLSKRTPQST